MTEHRFDPATGYCEKCGILKGWHAEECLATPNVTGFMHRLIQRRVSGEAATHGLDYPPVEKFPPKPPESA
jgi:hypothetical protein